MTRVGADAKPARHLICQTSQQALYTAHLNDELVRRTFRCRELCFGVWLLEWSC
jgi:hypothetical protein